MQPTQALISRVQSGQAWTADTSIQSISLNSYLRFKAYNSGTQNVYVYSFGGMSSASITANFKTTSVSTSLANIITPRNQNIASSSTPSLTVTYDTSSSDISGSQLRALPLNTDYATFNDNIILLQPGTCVVLTAQFLLSATGIFHLCWFEQQN